jgi:hypothetical protein
MPASVVSYVRRIVKLPLLAVVHVRIARSTS